MSNPETVPYEDFQKTQLANQALREENEGLAKMLDQLKNDLKVSKPDKATLFGKMAVVMAAVKRVPKNGWNSFHKYAYPTETDLLEAVREILAEAGLALMVSVVESRKELMDIHDKFAPNNPDKTKKNWFTFIVMEFTLGCTDTGATVVTQFHGEGQDNDDKGLYKAYTNTMKYFLRQTFLIPTGDVQAEDDGRPMDVEYENPSQGYQDNGKQGDKGGKGKGAGKSTPNDKKPATGQSKANEAGMITVEQLEEKWKEIGGTKDNFKPFYDKQIKDGKNHAVINKFLDMKIADRKKMQEEGSAAKE
jgi:hypothetical protein